MHTDHISHESMRAYLLGLLSTDEASALEEEYFVNRAVFLKIQSEEAALIADYLNGNLRPREKQGFEQRYLEVPALRSKVEAARREHTAVRENIRPKRSLAWQLSFAAALVVVVVLGIWVYQGRLKRQQRSFASGQTPVQQSPRPTQQVAAPPTTQPKSPSGTHRTNRSKSPVQPQQLAESPSQVQPQSQVQPPSQSEPPTQAVIAFIYLTPGVTKGSNSKAREFQQPTAGFSLNLILDLPGHSAPTERTVQILNVRSDDSLRLVWSSDKLLTSVSAWKTGRDGRAHFLSNTGQKAHYFVPHAGQKLDLILPASLFQPGDYIIQTRTADNEIQESYFYRVLPPQNPNQK